ncbi:hypothetical protein M408DRAFT_187272 [Serendipita vermifera MAFF 305830]|uniref:Uncharacterized protein n=1 Tax=Serendipita vermifera MAFF 305830 TaxID=933852 RepID=A0A0C3BL90_SERVB|nr:hypothetical protein M408DRAFT_187272 [Serendipita vermifera MAFF 305830]
MDTIFSRYTELEKSLWPDEDLETLREGPAPRPEWQGGLENVDGLAALVNRYLPPNDSAPPIHFETTKIATSFQNAMKLTKSYGIVQKSPLTRLIRTSESWAQSSQSAAGNSTAFSLESWLNRRGTSALSTNSPYFSTTLGAESQKTTARIIDRLSRSSIDRGKGISSTSTSPRVSQDGSPSILSVTAATTSSTAASPTNPSFSIESPASSAAPSAVTRFLSRFSRRAEDTPKQPAAVNLKPEELDFLDMMPAMNPNSPLGSAIQKELESTGKYSGQAIGIGSSIISTPSPSRQGMVSPMAMNKLSSTANLGQISSKDFDTLLDAQILEIEDEKMRESLVAAAMISAPTDSRYSTLSLPFFGSKAPEGAQPLGKEPGSATSNTLLDDDDFDAFLSSPTPSNQPAQKQKPQPAATFSLTPSLFSAQNSTPTSFRATSPPNMGILGSARPSPTPSRNPTMAIMSGGSRPATPTTMAIAPLLPPPPGSKPIKATRQGDLLNQSGLGSSHTTPTHSRTNSSSAMNGGKAAQMASLLTLSPPVANPVPSPMPLTASRVVTPSTAPATGGLSAQDLSFFEGL